MLLLFIIVVCSGCGRLLVANGYTKSRRCPYCGKKNWLTKVKHVTSAKTAKEASELVQQLKKKGKTYLSN